MVRKHKIILAAILGLHLAGLIIFVALRTVGRDEGFYLNATRMVGMGKTVYADFFYTQLLLMPTVFSALALKGWTSFWILRSFAVAAGFLSALLLFAIVLRTTRNFQAVAVALFMYCFSGIIISIHTLYEPLVFAHFLSLAVFFFWVLYYEKRSLGYLILSGLFLSALVNHRAIFIVLVPLYIWSIWSLSLVRKLRNLLIFILSLIPLTIPTIIGISRSSGNFLYDTFIFQIYREVDRSIGGILSNRGSALLRTVLDPHLLIIIVLTLISIRYFLKNRIISSFKDLLSTPQGMALMNLILIAVIYFVPHPILRHYIEQYMAFAIIVIAFNLESLLEQLKRLVTPPGKRWLIAALAALYLISIVPYIAINIWGLRQDDRRYLQSEVKKITTQMLKFGSVSDTILAEWTGYPFFTGQTSLPYTEIIGFHWPLPLDHKGYMKHKLCDSVYLKDMIARKIPRLMVTVYDSPDYLYDALNAGYEKAFQSDVVSIYKRK